MPEAEKLVSVNYNKIVNWLMRQGIAIVLLLIFTIGGFMHYKTVTEKLEQDIKDNQTSIQILNDKLLECEKSKLDMIKDFRIGANTK